MAGRLRLLCMRMQRVLLALLVLGATLTTLSRPAAACSCATSAAGAQLADSEAAFIGTYIERGTSEDVEGDRDGFAGENIGYLFEVETYLKGDFTQSSLYVASADNGAGCGFETSPGDYVAVFMYGTADGIPNSGLCSYVDGTTAKASLASPGIDADAGDAQFLISSPNEINHLWLLDKSGRRAGFATRPEGLDQWVSLNNISLCPDSNLLVESWQGQVFVRDLTTLELVPDVVDPVDQGGWVQASCFSADANRVAIVDLNEQTTVTMPEPAESVRLTNQFGAVAVPRREAVIAYGQSGVTLVNADGTTEVLFDAEAENQGRATNQPPSVEGVSVSPAGNRIAFEVTHYWDGRPPSSTVYLIDFASEDRLEADYDVEGSMVSWLSEDRLWLGDYSGDHRLLDDNLSEVENSGETRFDASDWQSPVSSGELVWFLEGSELRAHNLATGQQESLAELALSPWENRLISLPEPITITADLPVDDGTQAPLGIAPTDEARPEPEPSPEDGGSDSSPEILDPPADDDTGDGENEEDGGQDPEAPVDGDNNDDNDDNDGDETAAPGAGDGSGSSGSSSMPVILAVAGLGLLGLALAAAIALGRSRRSAI